MELNEDKILDFLDGSLTGAEEEELLHRLAVSPERRVVLKQHLQLRELSAILAKKHNYIVPKVLTAQLFTNLSANGYAGPMYHAATDTDSLRNSLEANIGQSAQNVVDEKRGFRASSLIFSSVLSFIAGAFLVYLFISSPLQTANGTLAVNDGGSQRGNTVLPSESVTSIGTAAVGTAQPRVGSHQQATASAATVSSTQTVIEHSSREVRPIHSNSSISTSSVTVGAGFDSPTSAVNPSEITFAKINHSIDLGVLPAASLSHEIVRDARDARSVAVESRNVVINEWDRQNTFVEADQTPSQPIVTTTSLATNIRPAVTKNWWAGNGMFSTLDNLRRNKDYFGLEQVEDSTPFVKRTTVSLRSGGGRVPGRKDDYTGSLVEFKLSADIGSWLVAKVSFGQFMPYETEALSIGKNTDGVRMLKLEPVLQYKSVVGAELGLRMNVLGVGFEAMGGFLTDLRNGFIPRAGIFTSMMLQENLSLQMGIEGALYTHDIRPSLENKQTIFAIENPVLTNAMQERETAGFIGPALELAWHF